MKYLKLFENSSYQEIIYQDNFVPKHDGEDYRLEDLSIKEFNILSKEIKKYNIDMYIMTDLEFIDRKRRMVARYYNIYISICKMYDEWFCLNFYCGDKNPIDLYYKCDQLDGVINCIKNLPKY